jgi:hypothetical protein
MYIRSSEVVSWNAVALTEIPVFQFVDGRKVTDARLVHDRNALDPISVTDAGMVMEAIAVSRNAAAPMDPSTLIPAKVTVSRLAHR